MAIVRRTESVNELRDGTVPEACPMTAWFPHLWEFGSEATFADGSHRQLPTLTVFAEQGLWKLCLNDRAEGQVAFVSGATLTAALHALEAGLRDGTLDWRRPRKSARPGQIPS